MSIAAGRGASFGKCEISKLAKKHDFDAIHDSIHEMTRGEERHGKAFEGLLRRFFQE